MLVRTKQHFNHLLHLLILMQKGFPPRQKKEPSQRGQVQSVYIKKGVLFIILPREHYGTITKIFHLCNKFESAFLTSGNFRRIIELQFQEA
jgi:hypothetical protein